jgi:hypothetical protein
MKYTITLDLTKNVFTELPTIEASSPKEAAEKYTGVPVKRCITPYGGTIVVHNSGWPEKSYIYNRKETNP